MYSHLKGNDVCKTCQSLREKKLALISEKSLPKKALVSALNSWTTASKDCNQYCCCRKVFVSLMLWSLS